MRYAGVYVGQEIRNQCWNRFMSGRFMGAVGEQYRSISKVPGAPIDLGDCQFLELAKDLRVDSSFHRPAFNFIQYEIGLDDSVAALNLRFLLWSSVGDPLRYEAGNHSVSRSISWPEWCPWRCLYPAW